MKIWSFFSKISYFLLFLLKNHVFLNFTSLVKICLPIPAVALAQTDGGSQQIQQRTQLFL